MNVVLKTNNYDMFKKHENNRTIDACNLKKIVGSIRANNLLQFRPIVVDSQYRVIDGQHRLEAAKALGIEIHYQVMPSADHQDIVLLNANQKRWSTDDWVNYYISLGNENYIKLKKYADEKGISVVELKRLIGGRSAKHTEGLKYGNYEFFSDDLKDKYDKLFDKIEQFIHFIANYSLSATGPTFFKSVKFKASLVVFLSHPDVDFETLKAKTMYKFSVLRPCANACDYLILLRDIYNWKNPYPINVKEIQQ